MCKIIAISNCKGGCGKSTTAINISTAIAKSGKRVLLVDNDPQGNATTMVRLKPNEIKKTLASLMVHAIDNVEFTENVLQYIINANGIDILPSNIMLSTIETKLMNAYGREYVLKTILSKVCNDYEYIIIDCLPSPGLLTINALTAADSVLIPVESHYLCYEGLESILESIKHIKVKLNPNLKIEGIVITMYQSRTKLCQGIDELVKSNYGNNVKIFDKQIPYSIKVAEQALIGDSILNYDPKNLVSVNYTIIAEEMMANA